MDLDAISKDHFEGGNSDPGRQTLYVLSYLRVLVPPKSSDVSVNVLSACICVFHVCAYCQWSEKRVQNPQIWS